MKRLLASVAVLSLVLTNAINPATAAPASCADVKEEQALQARVIQTELMVAALACNKAPRYNEFVLRHQKELMAAHERLRKFFQRTRGKAGGGDLNAFITRLANDSSQRSIQNRKVFCEQTALLYDGALQTEAAKLASFVVLQPVSQLHGIKVCATMADAKAAIPVPVRKPVELRQASAL